jgi:hypothetical protein
MSDNNPPNDSNEDILARLAASEARADEAEAQIARERERTARERERADGAVAQLATAEARIVTGDRETKRVLKVAARATARSDRKDALMNGTFFSTIDDVWNKVDADIQNPLLFGLTRRNRVSLIRPHDVVVAYNDWVRADDRDFDNVGVSANRRYEKTVIKANDVSADAANEPTAIAASQTADAANEQTATEATGNRNNSTNNDVSTVASSSSRSRLSASGENIFGERSTGAESAHLLPHAPSCANYWIPVVPWVLCTGTIPLSWDFMQKCIHGTLKQAADGKRKKHSHVGIKHFPTNRIRLDGQKAYLDNNPCVIAVPILPLAKVRDWNGVAYQAIVLAGNYTDLERQITVGAAEVYRGIHASANMQNYDDFVNDLATKDECNAACLLLKQYLFFVIQAFRANADLMRANANDLQNFIAWNNILNKPSVHVPVSNLWDVNRMKVRKVSFGVSTSPVNPAPDPVLLLAKAASNWLKRHNFAILPGCGDDDSGSTSDDSTDSTALSYSEEESMQGRSRTAKKPCIAEVNINVNRDEVEEPLSDDEFLFDK